MRSRMETSFSSKLISASDAAAAAARERRAAVAGSTSWSSSLSSSSDCLPVSFSSPAPSFPSLSFPSHHFSLFFCPYSVLCISSANSSARRLFFPFTFFPSSSTPWSPSSQLSRAFSTAALAAAERLPNSNSSNSIEAGPVGWCTTVPSRRLTGRASVFFSPSSFSSSSPSTTLGPPRSNSAVRSSSLTSFRRFRLVLSPPAMPSTLSRVPKNAPYARCALTNATSSSSGSRSASSVGAAWGSSRFFSPGLAGARRSFLPMLGVGLGPHE
mmetsp:Transcript_3392/g.12569  ORF Transcript_3392/g.12569 Transcript_3392/m.12569 type:complete len:270 (-) Transcript_3392:75-884(-)